jgi:shikimate kinase
MKSGIVLIGPIGAGKSTIAKLLSAELGLSRCCMDDVRWRYMEEVGFERDIERQILARDGHYGNVFRYRKPFEAHMVERLLAEHRNCIIDFGASQSVDDDDADIERVRRALAPFAHIVLLLPSPDKEESLRIIKQRTWDGVAGGFDFQAYFVQHPSNYRLATMTVYTEGKTPEQTCSEIVARMAETEYCLQAKKPK